MFKALVLNKQDDAVTAAVEDVDEARLPEGDVTIAVEYSTLNYKDGLITEEQGGARAHLSARAGHRLRRSRGRERASRLASGRRRGVDRLGRRRAPLGRPRPARPGQGRLARAIALGLAHGARHGGRHGGLHGDACRASRSRTMGSGPATARSWSRAPPAGLARWPSQS